MTTVHEAIQAVELEQRQRAARKEQSADKFQKFYQSAAWKRARWRFMASQPKPLRCAACGASAKDVRLAVDHIVSLRKDWGKRFDQDNMQMLCAADCNWLGKGRDDSTDFRSGEVTAHGL